MLVCNSQCFLPKHLHWRTTKHSVTGTHAWLCLQVKNVMLCVSATLLKTIWMAPFEVEKQPPVRSESIWGKRVSAKLWKGATVGQQGAEIWKQQKSIQQFSTQQRSKNKPHWIRPLASHRAQISSVNLHVAAAVTFWFSQKYDCLQSVYRMDFIADHNSSK